MAQVDLTKSPIIQSPYTYLQAAGSDGSDRTVKGVHLRWDFLKLLGDNHLAKGDNTNYEPYISNVGFNRPNDYIKIFRTRFNQRYFTSIDFSLNPKTEIKTGTIRTWKYVIPVDNLPGTNTVVSVRFIDYSQYDTIRASQATLNTINLLNTYTGIVEVEADNKLSFYVELDLKFKSLTTSGRPTPRIRPGKLRNSKLSIDPTSGIDPIIPINPGYLRVESVTIPDTSDFAQKQVSCRKKITEASAAKIVSCENIQYLRFDYFNAEWQGIRIYCYQDYIAGTNTQTGNDDGWSQVGDFSLRTEDSVVTSRFMPDVVDGTGGHWPKFNDDNPSTGEFTVNKQNYFNRWRRPGFLYDPMSAIGNDLNGLQYFVHKYMELSKTDERALASIPSDTFNDPTTQDISYVDMIRLMSLDYHVARMLGLGHIDDYGELQAAPYLYCLEYKTFVKLEKPYTTNAERTHIFMTPPVFVKDYRLPAAPILTPPTYGISVDNGTSAPTLLTDKEGYAPFGNIRFININRGPFNFEKPFGPFYYEPTEFCLCDETQPIAYGLEYKEISEPAFRKPEISHDSEYFDASGLPETLPILEGGTPKIFTHQETEEGTHEYRSYAINWFSRVSSLSNPVTAITAFPPKANLLPPFNFAVQLIQDEDPAETIISDKALILTTPAEQSLLAAIPAGNDSTLVRTTFDWNHVHHHAHQYADYADVFFRRAEPMVVKGKIDSVIQLPGNRAQITTTSYDITSTFPKTTVAPTILSSDAGRFAGSFLSAGGENYVVESVSANGVNPTFIIKQLKQINAVAASANSGQYISSETFQSPPLNVLFFITENMGALSNWDLRYNKRVYLEKFYTNAQVTLRFSPKRKRVFDIKQVLRIGGDTLINIENPIDTVFVPGLTLEYSVQHEIQTIAANTFTISGNTTADFAPGKQFRVFANKANDGLYTVNASSVVSGNIIITVNEPIPDSTNINGLIEIVVSRSVIAIDHIANAFKITGDKVLEINAAHCEYKPEKDGTLTRFVVGGINDSVAFMPIFKKPPVGTRPMLTGTGFIQLIFQNYNLLPHPDPEVNWHKGTVRLKDVSNKVQVYPVTYIGNLVNQSFPHLALVIQDPGFIAADDPSNQSGGDIYTLDLDNVQNANYHPAYKLYLSEDNGIPLSSTGVNFQQKDILPDLTDPNEGSRQTLMAIRSYDVKNDLASFLSNPVVLLAQKNAPPVKPSQPEGPLYATRPDFYGKSTYTFDTEMDTSDSRVPYSVVFYRTSEDRVLDVLYKKKTQETIWTRLEVVVDSSNPDGPKPKHDPQLWQILLDVRTSGAEFETYLAQFGDSVFTFKWPLPDNDTFFLTYETNKPLNEDNPVGGHVYPFEKAFDFTGTYSIYDKSWTLQQIVKRAIQDAFLPLNEQPPIFNYFKKGTVTSSVKSKLRNASGNLLDPLTNDLFPMIRILNDSKKPGVYVRFTDYTLDGASKSLYFYRVVEMDDKFKFSEASSPLGPVLMVNAFPPDKPQIRKVLTQLQDLAANKPSAILFEINAYGENEKISKVEIYRAIDEIDALSVRTMKKVKSVTWGTALIDDFGDLDFPPYGETLYYRIVAIREIEDVEDVLLPLLPNGKQPTVIVDMPSLPSDVSKASIVDVINPAAPRLSSENGTTTATELNNVVLKWQATCYNGTYRLQKLNASGNWVPKYSVKVKEGAMQYPPLDINGQPDFGTFSETEKLLRVDTDGNLIYHRFRVQVENASGLFNLSEFALTLAKGASDLQEIDSVLSYSDANNHHLPILTSFDFVEGTSHPDQMVFTHLNEPLPAGHNAFVAIEITVSDDLTGSITRTINTPGGTAVVNIGDGGLNLDNAYPNRIYTIKTKLFTDAAPAGAAQVFTINYLSGTSIILQQGRRNLPVFDPGYYLDQYPDLQAAFGAQNYAAATVHWLTYGISEGRKSSPTFDVSFYLGHYADLQTAFGVQNYIAAVDHWITYGINEGRKGSP